MRTAKKENALDPEWVNIALKRLAGIEKRCKCGACEPPKPKLPAGMRRLKVQPKYITDRPSKNPTIPVILLQGEWLRDNGFECATHVIVIEEQGRLIIQPEKA